MSELTKGYQITKEQCEKMIRGVCSSCGGKLEPIETVDNSNQPTYWAGCNSCNKFCWGVDEQIYKIAHTLVHEHAERVYHEPEPAKPDERDYWFKSQVSGMCFRVAITLKLYESSLASRLAEAQIKTGEAWSEYRVMVTRYTSLQEIAKKQERLLAALTHERDEAVEEMDEANKSALRCHSECDKFIREIDALKKERDEMREFARDVVRHELQFHHTNGCMTELMARAKFLASQQKEGK